MSDSVLVRRAAGVAVHVTSGESLNVVFTCGDVTDWSLLIGLTFCIISTSSMLVSRYILTLTGVDWLRL